MCYALFASELQLPPKTTLPPPPPPPPPIPPVISRHENGKNGHKKTSTMHKEKPISNNRKGKGRMKSRHEDMSLDDEETDWFDEDNGIMVHAVPAAAPAAAAAAVPPPPAPEPVPAMAAPATTHPSWPLEPPLIPGPPPPPQPGQTNTASRAPALWDPQVTDTGASNSLPMWTLVAILASTLVSL